MINILGCAKSLKRKDNKYIYSLQVLYFFDLNLKRFIKNTRKRKKIIKYFREIKKKGPKLSIIFPFHNNNEKYIVKFLDYLFNQTF